METTAELVHLERTLVDFGDFGFEGNRHAFRWVDIKRFGLGGTGTHDRDVLAALIAHPQFRDTYDGAGARDWPRHGQWWVERITPDSYAPVPAQAAVDLLETWTLQHGPVPPALLARLEREVHAPARRAHARYLLVHPPEDARHDYGPVHTDFHELVLVDRATDTVTLLVAADD
ncbi:hypothetical protein ACFVVA_18420 [Kitasatospora sp. NPDC058048]|uniref:hypothetical protein n=1 Tax=Kitasatospora sp. NPDC058048 TaxID=3346313 RepID=UPI0036DFA2BA